MTDLLHTADGSTTINFGRSRVVVTDELVVLVTPHGTCDYHRAKARLRLWDYTGAEDSITDGVMCDDLTGDPDAEFQVYLNRASINH